MNQTLLMKSTNVHHHVLNRMKNVVYQTSAGRMASDQCTQTEFTKYMLSAKVETIMLRNEVTMLEGEAVRVVSSLSHDDCQTLI